MTVPRAGLYPVPLLCFLDRMRLLGIGFAPRELRQLMIVRAEDSQFVLGQCFDIDQSVAGAIEGGH